MKSIATAALVLIIEAGFVLSLAMLPSRGELAPPAPQAEVAAQAAPAPPASRS